MNFSKHENDNSKSSINNIISMKTDEKDTIKPNRHQNKTYKDISQKHKSNNINIQNLIQNPDSNNFI